MAGTGEAKNKNVLVVEDENPVDVTQYVGDNANITSIPLQKITKGKKNVIS